MDLKSAARDAFANVSNLFLKDLEALPEEAFQKSLGGQARTVSDLVYEVNLVNSDICAVLRGETTPEWPDEGWIKAPEGFSDKKTVIDAFKKCSEDAISTIESFPPDSMEATVHTEHGDRSRYQRCQFMTLHLWYHSGQLNYIQTLLGDDKWHWQ